MRLYLAILLFSFQLTSIADEAYTSKLDDDQLILILTRGEIGAADHIEEPVLYGVELQYSSFELYGMKFLPALGYSESENGTRFTYVNFRQEFWLSNDWVLTPMFGFGSFIDSDEIILGHEFEFVSGLEIAYELPNKLRVGFMISHLSNAGISSTNPGTETISLSFSMPLIE